MSHGGRRMLVPMKMMIGDAFPKMDLTRGFVVKEH